MVEHLAGTTASGEMKETPPPPPFSGAHHGHPDSSAPPEQTHIKFNKRFVSFCIRLAFLLTAAAVLSKCQRARPAPAKPSSIGPDDAVEPERARPH
ncbi:unnamed protein product [Boreogadus saida]